MRHARILVLWLGALLAPFAADAGSATPSDAVQGFYRVYATFHPSDGIPNAAGLAEYAPYLSPHLHALLQKGADAEARFAKANKNSPPLIEGDLFTSMFEGATGVKPGTCKVDGGTAHCTVDLVYDDGKDKPTRWTDTLVLVKSTDGWGVDDILFGGSWAFANKGKLSDTLNEAIADSGY